MISSGLPQGSVRTFSGTCWSWASAPSNCRTGPSKALRVRPAVEVKQADGKPGLPESVLSLVIPPGPGAGEVRFFNGDGEDAGFSWRPEGGAWRKAMLKPGETVKNELNESHG